MILPSGFAEAAMAQVSSPGAPAGPDAEFANEVLRIVVELAEELHPHQRGRTPPGLDGDLDDDFGLDSLGRVEVIHRLEAAFNTTLPEELFAEASTGRDLVEAVSAAGPHWKPSPAAVVESRAAPEASA
ncbi:MAG: acyl carrier protein, partial [Parcubacteria group bacterium]